MERDESNERDRELGRELSRGVEEIRAEKEGRKPEPKAPRQSLTLSVLIPALVASALWLLFSILGDESAKVGGELTAAQVRDLILDEVPKAVMDKFVTRDELLQSSVKNLYDETATRVSNLESRVKELGDKSPKSKNGAQATLAPVVKKNGTYQD